MNPTLDQFLVALFIIAALGFFLRRALRKRKGCDSGCGCGVAEKGRAVGPDVNVRP